MFPELYHAHHSLANEDLPFWLNQAGGASDELLELGCGTGRVLLPLSEQKPRVFGLDYDAQMLGYLQRRLKTAATSTVRLIQADFTSFRLKLKFERIFLPCNTYSTLPAERRRMLLERAGAHLSKNGRFVCSLPNPAALMNLPMRAPFEVEEIFPHPHDGEPVQVSSSWRRDQRTFTLYWRYDHLHPDGTVSSFTASTKHFLAPVRSYLDELAQAGFAVQNLWGDYDYSEYQPSSPHLIIAAQYTG